MMKKAYYTPQIQLVDIKDLYDVLGGLPIPISRHGQPYLGLLLYIVASIALAWVVDKLIKRIPLPKR